MKKKVHSPAALASKSLLRTWRHCLLTARQVDLSDAADIAASLRDHPERGFVLLAPQPLAVRLWSAKGSRLG